MMDDWLEVAIALVFTLLVFDLAAGAARRPQRRQSEAPCYASVCLS